VLWGWIHFLEWVDDQFSETVAIILWLLPFVILLGALIGNFVLRPLETPSPTVVEEVK
jgi:hypothetical protein